MPIWREGFSAAAPLTDYREPAEYIARGRVPSLVNSLESIKE